MTRYFKFVSGLTLTVFVALGAWAEDPAHVDQLRGTNSCAGCELSGAVLDGENLSLAVLTDASMYGTSLNATNLGGADLSGAKLSLAQLDGADLSSANLTGADLSRTDLSTANLDGAVLTDTVTDESTTCPDGSVGPCSF